MSGLNKQKNRLLEDRLFENTQKKKERMTGMNKGSESYRSASNKEMYDAVVFPTVENDKG